MAALSSTQSSVRQLAVRGSHGIQLISFTVESGVKGHSTQSLSSSQNCRVLEFSTNGVMLAWCDGSSVEVVDVETGTVLSSIPRPKTRCLQFSPQGTLLSLWEPYIGQRDEAGKPNLEIWNIARNEKTVAVIQKRQREWCPQWSNDEKICFRSVTNEVHCFESGTPDSVISNRLVVEGLASYSVSPSSSCKIAVYVPGSKGAPSFVRMYQYPSLSTVIASRSFYRADSVNFTWNKKGSAVLVVTSTDVDKTGSSYYGEQGLLYLSAHGDGNLVILDKKGPIYDVQWHPNLEEFCVLYGFMPCKATLFNRNSDPIYDFGTGHRNIAQFNPHGSILCLAGFGNLRGNMEFWDCKSHKLLGKAQASDSTHFQWCPDGVHVVTATTAPRLREGNGYKLWHFTGSLIHHNDTPPKQELWEVTWRPLPMSAYSQPDVSVPAPPSISTSSSSTSAPKTAYVPPALRGRQKPSAPSDQTKPLSKSALKNQRKKQQKQEASTAGQSQEQRDAVSMTTHLMGGASVSGGGDVEKKIRNLKKKLRQIEELKQQQANGAVLELNQLEKIKTEDSIRTEIEKLELSSK